ncbi:glycosyltransferase family 1 protein [Noviherbaspirillum sp. UKPF54]|uniref:glycosyltransferase family 4 protein n=1 Tax=Noviherbaspirillum sp. UKPF54 TaxID=2601898 RepID=UPI00143DA13C|nr:glycosyltransferase family 1 protein [Noviherbaspirillum sp. UKPF54]
MFYTAESGGVRTYLTAKGNWLARQTSIEHVVVAPSMIEAKGARFIGVPSLPIPYAKGYRMPLSCRIAAHKIQQLQPDLIEVGDPYQLAWAALRVRDRTGTPTVGFCHSDLPRLIAHRFGPAAQRLASRYMRSLYRHFDMVLAPSRTVTKQLHDMGIAQARHQPLGVDMRMFSPTRRNPALRRELGLPEQTRLLVYAGRFTREKRLPLLLDAVRRLGDPYHLVMIGSGGALPSASRVTYLPFQRDAAALAGLIASCDMLVHPGDQETFGLIVLEAMACGIPVVGADAGGISELIDDSSGVLVRPGSAAALAEGIRHLYEKDIGALGRNAHRRTAAQYDWSRVLPQLMRHYASLFAAHRQVEFGVGSSYAPD